MGFCSHWQWPGNKATLRVTVPNILLDIFSPVGWWNMTPEYRTVQRNTSDIHDAIANQSDPGLFANKLVDNGFIPRQAADNILQTLVLPNDNKVSRLIQEVELQLRTASNPTTVFETFIRILRELSLDQLADKLVKYYSKCFGCRFAMYYSIWCIVDFYFWFQVVSILYVVETLSKFSIYQPGQLKPDYRGPLSSQGVSESAPSGTSLQQELSTSLDLCFAQIIFCQSLNNSSNDHGWSQSRIFLLQWLARDNTK